MKRMDPDFLTRLKDACAAENAQFRIVYHINPDGDCIGSAYALALILRALGAKTAVCGRDAVPAQFGVLTGAVPMDVLDDTAPCLAVDCKDRSRTGDPYRDKDFAFWIDHHECTARQGASEYVDSDRSACSELILEIAEALGVTVTQQIAELLLTALITDTSRFCTVSTNAQTFDTAAKLTRYGADPYQLGRRFEMVKSDKRLAVESRIFADLHFLCGGKLVTGMLTQQDLAAAGIASQRDSDLQNINNLLEVIGGVKIAVMIREYPAENPEGRTRFSIKSTDSAVVIDTVAVQLGGGGHKQAAGGFLNEPPERAREILEQTCAAYLAEKGLA